jgi:amino acid adenylation domain-containing protein
MQNPDVSKKTKNPMPWVSSGSLETNVLLSNLYVQFLFGDNLIPQLVESRAAARPDALAVSSDKSQLLYGDLDASSNRLARYLQFLGIGKGKLVGLCLERSAELVQSALAILKTGAAYLPLDPFCPSERLNYILNDARVSLMLTRQDLIAKIPSGAWKIANIAAEQAIAEFPSGPLPTPLHRDDPAYVIYTSGSTGKPKGVQVNHRNLLNLVQWHHQAFHVTSRDRATLLSNPGFDASVWEIWSHLTAGASLHVPEENTRLSPDSLRDWLVAHQITITFVPTALAERLIDLDWPPAALRFLLTGADTLKHYPSKHLPFTFVNNYGPTECTVVATSGIVSPHDRPCISPPIGRPISNVKVRILDERMRPVAAGQPGELWIGGDSVSQGYLNHPELTGEKFFFDPFTLQPGARLYRTGDCGRFLPDGQIEFLGRIDDQVKIRGFRVELNEIAVVLASHPAVETCFVTSRPNRRGERELLAYIVQRRGHDLRAKSLREHVASHLPDYMVPSVFVRVESLPLGPHGKLDRTSLPAPDSLNTIGDDSFESPRTEAEKQVAEIVSKLLDLESVSISDNFFSLGGHSLLGTQLIARIRQSFGVALTLRTLFDHPTIAGISAEIDRAIGQKPLPKSA